MPRGDARQPVSCVNVNFFEKQGTFEKRDVACRDYFQPGDCVGQGYAPESLPRVLPATPETTQVL